MSDNAIPQPSELEADARTALIATAEAAATHLKRALAAEAQIAKLQADGDKLAGAATALRDDMLMRAEMRKRRNNGELVVEAGNGVWHRINEALTEWEDRA